MLGTDGLRTVRILYRATHLNLGFAVSGPNIVVFYDKVYSVNPDSNKNENVKRVVYQAYNEARKIVVMLVGFSMSVRSYDKRKCLVLQRYIPSYHLFKFV